MTTKYAATKTRKVTNFNIDGFEYRGKVKASKDWQDYGGNKNWANQSIWFNKMKVSIHEGEDSDRDWITIEIHGDSRWNQYKDTGASGPKSLRGLYDLHERIVFDNPETVTNPEFKFGVAEHGRHTCQYSMELFLQGLTDKLAEVWKQIDEGQFGQTGWYVDRGMMDCRRNSYNNKPEGGIVITLTLGRSHIGLGLVDPA